MNKTKTESAVTGTATNITKEKALTPKEIVQKYTFQDKEKGQDLFLDQKGLYKELSLSEQEATDFLNGENPFDYFREGLVHKSVVKLLGDKYTDEDEEYQVVKRMFPKEKTFLLFKQKKSNVYIILVPKVYSEYELNDEQEFVNEHIHYDIRVVTFTGGSSPAAYEPVYFEQRLKEIVAKCVSVYERRRLNLTR